MKTKSGNARTTSILEVLLQTDLGFHGSPTGNGRHNLHAFAAKFPPELPRFFVEALTKPGDIVLDPMAGSGTTLVEASILGRTAFGVDRDPLALMVTTAKLAEHDSGAVTAALDRTLDRAQTTLFTDDSEALIWHCMQKFSAKTREFLDYWFMPQTQAELAAITDAINHEPSRRIRRLLNVTLSSIIVTKSGGVTRARDLAHTRPHLDHNKSPKNAVVEFGKRALRVSNMLAEGARVQSAAGVCYGDARHLPIPASSIDLIVTSPPYANAIDYMRAHKFSLVWFGYPIEQLSTLRGKYIGNERQGYDSPKKRLPGSVASVVRDISRLDSHRGTVHQNYFLDMQRAISEMFRVLRTGGSIILVVGPSSVRGLQVKTHEHLAHLMTRQGFRVVDIAQRTLDRDRRLMPVASVAIGTGIQQRIHTEYVIGAVKP